MSAPTMVRMACDQCSAARVNGVFCHETGCPNGRKTWVADRGWVKFMECWNCGCEVEVGGSCGCMDDAEVRP